MTAANASSPPRASATPQGDTAGPAKLHEVVALRPLRIALLGYRSHPFVGGQGIYLKYLSRALRALGHSVDVYSGPPYPELDEGIPLIPVPSLDLYAHENHVRALRPHHLRSFSDTFEWWSMLTGGFPEPYTFGRRVAKRLADGDYDVIHDNQSLCYGLLALQKQGRKVISTVHHPIHRDRDIALAQAPRWGDRLLIKRWYSFLGMQRKVAQRLHHVVTVSASSQRDIATYFGRPATRTPVIPNGIDSATFRPLPHIPREPHRLITTASSDQPLKGLDVLLQAIACIRLDYPGIHLRVVGKLREDGSTTQQLRQLGLAAQVSFVSGISTEALVEEFARASLFVCPSRYEGFGLPLGEAMACGLPVISSDGGALPEVVGDAGIVVPAGETGALSEAIAALLDDETARHQLGERARQRILDQFCWSRVALSLTDYYRHAEP